MNRAFTNILCQDVQQTARFYEALLGLKPVGDFGWFILLGSDETPGFELGILQRNHETIPPDLAVPPAGVILTFVVADVEKIYSQALAMDVEILQAPTDLPYGQRRLLLRDPAGSTVDISAPIQ